MIGMSTPISIFFQVFGFPSSNLCSYFVSVWKSSNMKLWEDVDEKSEQILGIVKPAKLNGI